jgi:hypothetical protein
LPLFGKRLEFAEDGVAFLAVVGDSAVREVPLEGVPVLLGPVVDRPDVVLADAEAEELWLRLRPQEEEQGGGDADRGEQRNDGEDEARPPPGFLGDARAAGPRRGGVLPVFARRATHRQDYSLDSFTSGK